MGLLRLQPRNALCLCVALLFCTSVGVSQGALRNAAAHQPAIAHLDTNPHVFNLWNDHFDAVRGLIEFEMLAPVRTR